jgi:hypothetical protein
MSKPNHTSDTSDWIGNYGDITPSGTLPIYGVRVCVSLDSEGRQQYTWGFDNTEQVNQFELAGVLGALSREVADHMLKYRVSEFDPREGEG